MAKELGEREDPTWGTNGSSNVTAGSPFEDVHEAPASPAMTGAPTAPATAEQGELFYFIQLFYYTSFPFFKGCRLEKGHIVPVLYSHSYKKKSKELLRHREELFHPHKGGKDLGSYGIDSHAQVSCRLRGHEIGLLVIYHNPQRVTKRQQFPDVSSGHTPPRRQGPASRPGTVEIESHESAPTLTRLHTLG